MEGTTRSPVKEHHSFTSSLKKLIPWKHGDPHVPTDIAFAFDIDGVLVRGKDPVPGAHETLKMLQERGIPFLFLTNGGGKTEQDHVDLVGKRLGLKFSVDQFVQSHTPFMDLVDQYKDKNVLVLGGDGVSTPVIAEAYGFKKVFTSSDVLAHWKEIHPFSEFTKEHHLKNARHTPATHPGETPGTPGMEIAAIMVYSSPRDWCLDLQTILDLLLSSNGLFGERSPKNDSKKLPNHGYLQDGQPRLHFCNADFEWKTAHPYPRLAQGAFKEALRGLWAHATRNKAELQYDIVGKPTRTTYEYGERLLHKFNKSQNKYQHTNNTIKTIYMVGDNPESDISGAMAYESLFGTEWKSILVETGVYSAGTVPSHQPTHTTTDVKTAVQWVLDQHGIDPNVKIPIIRRIVSSIHMHLTGKKGTKEVNEMKEMKEMEDMY